MPHYANGQEAQVGHQVYGKLYNTPEVVCGVIISITPGQDPCNAQVQFTLARRPDEEIPHMAILNGHEKERGRRVKGERHGTDGAEYILYTCVDYCGCSELNRVQ